MSIDTLFIPGPTEFEHLGLIFRRKYRLKSKPVGDFVVYQYFHDKSGIQMEVFTNIDVTTKPFISFIIAKDSENDFSVEDYLIAEKRDDWKKIADLKADPETKFRLFLNLASTILSSDLRNVVLGKVWIDIPNFWVRYEKGETQNE